MNQKEIIVGKDKLILSERSAAQVIGLSKFVQEEDKPDTSIFGIIVMAYVISSSLRNTVNNIPVYKFYQRIRYHKYTESYILDLPQSEILKLYEAVIEIEGFVKKKTPDNLSAETSPEG